MKNNKDRFIVVYTDPDYELDDENIYDSAKLYKSKKDFEKQNHGMKALVLIDITNYEQFKTAF